MPIICLIVRENHKMVREMSGKSQGILWGLMAGHPDYGIRIFYRFSAQRLNWVNIGADNDLSPACCQAIT